MPRRDKTNIYSIFGQIETVVAEAMCTEGKLRRIEADMIPATQLYDDFGNRAKLAVVMSAEHEREYNRRVAQLYA